MKVKVPVTEREALVAIMYAIANDPDFSISRKKFRKAVIDYISHFGPMCTEDHEIEYGTHKKIAKKCVDLYY